MIDSKSSPMDKGGIYLRKVEFSDVERVLHWENKVEGWNMDDKDREYTLFDIIVLISEMQDVETSKQIRFMICHPSVSEPIGAADLTDINFGEGRAGVGVLIADPGMRNRGFASNALVLLEQEAKNLNIKHLKSTVLCSNEVSLHLFEKLGYEKLANREELYVVQGEYIKAFVFEKCLNAF
jgi:diamine N-acetyltransferase